MWLVLPCNLLVTQGYLVNSSGYLVVTSGYLIVTIGYFSLLLVTSRYFWFLVLVTTTKENYYEPLAAQVISIIENPTQISSTKKMLGIFVWRKLPFNLKFCILLLFLSKTVLKTTFVSFKFSEIVFLKQQY